MINTLHLGLSYACNMKCKHCFVDKSKDLLDFDIVKSTIKYLYDNCGLLIVYYTYGEPFLCSKLYEMLSYCAELNLIQIIMSNGSLLSEFDCKTIRAYNIDRVYISIDSCNPQKHDANRNYDGAFQRAVNSLRLLKSTGVKCGIATTVNRSNEDDIPEIAALAEKLDVSALSLLRERTTRGISEINKRSNYYSFFREYIINPKKYSLFVHDCSMLPIIEEVYRCGIISSVEREKWIDMNSCHSSTTISIAPNGDVKSCNLYGPVVANLNMESIDTIVNRLEACHEYPSCCAQFPRPS